MAQLTPNLINFLKVVAHSCTVAEALHDNTLLKYVKGTPSVPTIVEFLDLCAEVQQIRLGCGRIYSPGGSPPKGSTRPNLRTLHSTSYVIPCAHELWRSWEPLELKVFDLLTLCYRLKTIDKLTTR